MIGTNENQNEELYINQSSIEMEALTKTQHKEKIEELSNKLTEDKENLLKSNKIENIIRSSILSFVLQNFSSKDSRMKKLTKELIDAFSQKNLIELTLNILKKIPEDLKYFKAMIEFKKDINKENQYLEIYFKILILAQNINDLIEGIKVLMNIKNDKIEKLLSNLDFQNPYAIILIRDFIYELITVQNKSEWEIVLNNIINDLKKYFFFHCPKCLGMLYVNFYQGITITCANHQLLPFSPKNIDELKDYFNFIIKCINCNKNIEIYENNYKCVHCCKLFCHKCATEHRKENIKNVLIKIYEVGYICEEHCQLYSTFCSICKLNLCEFCKENHFHKIEQEKYLYKLREDLNGIMRVEEYISAELSLIYKFMKEFSLNNLFIILSLFLKEVFKREDNSNSSKSYFKAFFDDNFRNYYSKIIQDVSIGKTESYNHLLLIKGRYEESKINIDKSFFDFEKKIFT